MLEISELFRVNLFERLIDLFSLGSCSLVPGLTGTGKLVNGHAESLCAAVGLIA